MRHFASKSQKSLERDERAAVFVVFITCRCARRLRRRRPRETFFIVAIEKNGRWEVDADDWIGPQYNEGGGHVGSILFENDLDG